MTSLRLLQLRHCIEEYTCGRIDDTFPFSANVTKRRIDKNKATDPQTKYSPGYRKFYLSVQAALADLPTEKPHAWKRLTEYRRQWVSEAKFVRVRATQLAAHQYLIGNIIA
jgi:hypothetical protein